MPQLAAWRQHTTAATPTLPHLQELLKLLAVLVHIPQDLDRHVLAAVGASKQITKRTWRQKVDNSTSKHQPLAHGRNS